MPRQKWSEPSPARRSFASDWATQRTFSQHCMGCTAVYYLRGELPMACALAEQLMRRAQSARDPARLILAHTSLGVVLSSMGKPLIAMKHLELAISLYDPERHPRLTTFSGRVGPLSYAGLNLWALGYPDQALKRSNEALPDAQCSRSMRWAL